MYLAIKSVAHRLIADLNELDVVRLICIPISVGVAVPKHDLILCAELAQSAVFVALRPFQRVSPHYDYSSWETALTQP